MTIFKSTNCSPNKDDDSLIINSEPEHLTWLALPRYEKNNMDKSGNNDHDDFMPSNDIGWMQKFKHVVVSECNMNDLMIKF